MFFKLLFKYKQTNNTSNRREQQKHGKRACRLAIEFMDFVFTTQMWKCDIYEVFSANLWSYRIILMLRNARHVCDVIVGCNALLILCMGITYKSGFNMFMA